MLKWIRWSGLTGFIVVAGLLVCFWAFAAGPLIKMAIESFGSDAVGAKVEVEDVSFGFSPLSLNIRGVQITDPDAPMTNMVSFETAVANIEPFPLLLGQAIIPELSLEGVAMGTPRSVSGAIAKAKKPKVEDEKEDKPKAETGEAKADAKSSELPSADDILAREKLLTVERGEALETAYQQHSTAIEQAVADLPTESDIKQYEVKLNTILKGKFESLDDFKQRKKALDELKAQFKKDKKAIAAAKSAIKNGKSDLKQKWSDLKVAPKQDLDNLKSKYTLDGAGASNLTALLFGGDAGGYAATTLEYYEKIRPLLVDEEAKAEKEALKEKRLEGRFVTFPTDRPQPDFWVKKLTFTMSLPQFKGQPSLGQVAVNVTDISHQQDVVGQPTRLFANGVNLKNIQSLKVTGVMDHRQSPGKDVFDLQMEKWDLDKVKLGLAGLYMDEASAYAQGGVTFSQGKMDLSSNILFKDTTFSTKDRTMLAKEMDAALDKVSRFNVEVSADGKVTSPSMNIRSDLDKQLQSAFNDRIDEKQKELEADLKKKLNEKLLGYAGNYESQLKDMNLAEGNLSDATKKLESLAKSEMSSYEDQLKAEAKAKADKEAAEAKAKAKAEADKKKKELEKKAKEKLKSLF